MIYIYLLFYLIGYCHSTFEPIVINGKNFVTSITNTPFIIKGVDYQPGGSSASLDAEDVLSNPKNCARDIVLFQDLGINTIRVYSVNPELNHDACMSILATAGIYLILDVNSPLPGQHLNRYEPHTTYTENYLEHVFKVIEQFSYYNNTLGFFAGNEIINDRASAKASPVFIKAVVRDMKNFIIHHSPRPIPVGYSAADDLLFRTSLSEYLECETESPSDAIDFYGVNSYQWCGEQTFYSSGYNVLVDDYNSYSKPVFLSEYGCNEITPRNFEEVSTIYSKDMTDVFSGGLVYEFSQEPNNYGLVKIDQDGGIVILHDYLSLKSQYQNCAQVDLSSISSKIRKFEKDVRTKQKSTSNVCADSYSSLDTSNGIPLSVANSLIEKGVTVQIGKYVELPAESLISVAKYSNMDGSPYDVDKQIHPKLEISQPENKLAFIKFQNRMYQ